MACAAGDAAVVASVTPIGSSAMAAPAARILRRRMGDLVMLDELLSLICRLRPSLATPESQPIARSNLLAEAGGELAAVLASGAHAAAALIRHEPGILGTTHWMTPTDAVPELCIEMRSPVVVTGSKLTWLNVLIAVGSPLWLLTSAQALPVQY
jgi:hypothetical protein